MSSLSVIILTQDEAANLPACLKSLEALDADVFVVDSGSTDNTRAIAEACGCRVVEHAFENYAAQRNWAFDNLRIESAWTLCLDADERLTPELASEIVDIAQAEACAYDGYMLSRRTLFMGRWLRHGGQYPAYHTRLFRTGRGRCESRLYDQHFMVEGKLGRLENDCIDVLASDLATWSARHARWAQLEAEEVAGAGCNDGIHPVLRLQGRLGGTPIERRRFLREDVYYRFPLFVRPLLYWFYSYVLRLGFLDGIPGLVFHALHKLWFRFLVDVHIYALRRERGTHARN